jgi:class 3 adenylate cyclase
MMRAARKVVTALFADLAGSTELSERLDPEDYREVMRGAIEAMIVAIEAFGGTIKDLAGDGVLALFGAPVAHEDDQERAVLAGLRIVESMASYGADVARRWGEQLFVRVGIETGLVVLGPVGASSRIEYGAVGDAVIAAFRLQSSASLQTVLVGEAARRGIEQIFEWGAVQELSLKGKAQPVAARQALGLRPGPRAVGRARTAPVLVGREAEMAMLRAAISNVRGSAGGLVCITGDAGVGKSRLVEESRKRAFEDGFRMTTVRAR